METSKYTRNEVVTRLINDGPTKNDWEKSRKSLDDDDFNEYCNSVYDNSSDADINEFMTS